MQRNGSISIDELAAMSGQTREEWERDYEAAEKALDSPPTANADAVTPAVDPRPSASIVPFPMRHRQRWIAAQRQRAATFPHREREWLASQVDKYEDRLIEIGVVPALVESETDDLQRAFFGGDHDRTARA